ncbi:MAG TPA: pitrilysin family protein [Acidobacteriota bacterium]|nr:pitrilysin family protein [Acidobacteriota bacterium]
MTIKAPVLIAALLAAMSSVSAQHVSVEEYVLPNGMRLLMIPKKGDPDITAGWIARAGSVNERPGITGISHLLEHMMFKGTRTIGSTDIDREMELLEQIDDVKAEIRKEEKDLGRRYRLGLVSAVDDPAYRSDRHNELLREYHKIENESRRYVVPNEFDQVYTFAGASGLNAGTGPDYTIYFVNVPVNKLELWFWMESDRLLNPVFREFYAELDVVKEERRMRTESTPTGIIQEQFNAMFFASSPYSWSVVGWPSDLDGMIREDVEAYFNLHYTPGNITAGLVGDFDPEQVKKLADAYFGRLRPGVRPPPAVRTREVEQVAEKRMTAYADTNPEAVIRYHSVAEGHKDEPALMVLGSLLSGRTGRLHRSLVLDRKIANSASAGQVGMKYEGYFVLNGIAKPESSPEEVEQALYEEIEKLQKEKVGERELQKVKNQFAADNFRRLESRFQLLLQILAADSNRGWRSFNEDPKLIDAVTPEDIQRVANRYFRPENRAVVLYYTKQSGESGGDRLLDGLSEQEKTQIRQFRSAVAQMSVDEARAILMKLESDAEVAPPEKAKFVEAFIQLLQQKIQKDGGE